MEASASVQPVKLFYSYVYEDRVFRDGLAKQLAVLSRAGWISEWHDREIIPGASWEQEIDAHLTSADIILLLVSPNFMISDYAYGLEMRRALERHDRGEARVVPVILRPCFWEGAPFSKLQALPTNAVPIAKWRNRDAAFADIANSIYELVKILLPRKIVGAAKEEAVSYATTLPSLSSQITAAQLLHDKIHDNNFDVFLCHNMHDKPAVKQIGEYLKARGILPWLDEWELRPGFPWQRLLEQHIEHIKGAAVFVGKDGIGPWQQMELEAFLREFVNRGYPVIPVLLEDAPTEPKLPLFLRGYTWVDFRKPEPDPRKQLIWGITGEREYRW